MKFGQTEWMIIQTIILVLILIRVYKGAFSRAKLLGKRAITVFVHAATRLVPKDKRLIIFGGENGQGFRGNPKYLFLELNKNPDLRCVWIAKDARVVKELRATGYEAYLHNSREGIKCQLRAKMAIHSHSINDDFNKVLLGGAISYNTWHGVGLKKVWGANKKTFSYKIIHEKSFLKRFFGMFVVKTNNAKESYVVSTSERVSSYYPETFLVDKKNVLQMGQVRNDIFFQETEEDEQIPDWYKNNKVILYMPTHRNFGKLDSDINTVMDLPKLDKFCEKMGYTFVVKRHMYSNGTVSKDFKHIIDISDQSYDPQFLLKYADILVTDYSSCYTDYLLLNRPVIFYCYDLELYLQKSNDMYFDYFDVTPGSKPRTFTELLTAIQEVSADSSLFSKERERVLNIFYSKDNQNTVLEKQVNHIYKEILKIGLNQSQSHSDKILLSSGQVEKK